MKVCSGAQAIDSWRWSEIFVVLWFWNMGIDVGGLDALKRAGAWNETKCVNIKACPPEKV